MSNQKGANIYDSVIEPTFIRQTENEKREKEKEILGIRKLYAEDYAVLIQSLINTLEIEFREMFPGAEGFIEGRIKAINSILLKLNNKYQRAMDVTDLERQLGNLKKIDLTDILACSIVVTKPPKKFKTTDDKLNEKLNELAKELEITSNRIGEHKKRIEDKQELLDRQHNEIEALKQEINAIRKSGTSQEIEEMLGEYEDNDENKLQAKKLLCQMKLKELEKQEISGLAHLEEIKKDIQDGKRSLSRTQETYYKELLDIQREMAYAFVSNIANLQRFKMLHAKQLEQPELKNKPGFRATTAKYSVSFKDMQTKEEHSIVIEVQGKGEEDWKVAEFGKGALYHENQKTDEGQYSKQTELPDFTIIGRTATEDIEKSVRNRYGEKLEFKSISKMKTIEQRMQWYKDNNFDSELMEEEVKKLKKYIDKIQMRKEKAQDKATIVVNGEEKEVPKNSDEYQRYASILEKTAEEKIAEAIEATKESIIQSEIEKEINALIDEKADEIGFKKAVENKDNVLNKVYNDEVERLKELTGDNSLQTDEEIKHKARVKALYYLKEQEIREITENIVPIFFYSNMPDGNDEKSVVTYRSTGEAIYRYYYNRLHGLEDIKPQEQQKKALLKLTGLFKEDSDDFFVYDRKNNIRVDLEEEQEDPEK